MLCFSETLAPWLSWDGWWECVAALRSPALHLGLSRLGQLLFRSVYLREGGLRIFLRSEREPGHTCRMAMWSSCCWWRSLQYKGHENWSVSWLFARRIAHRIRSGFGSSWPTTFFCDRIGNAALVCLDRGGELQRLGGVICERVEARDAPVRGRPGMKVKKVCTKIGTRRRWAVRRIERESVHIEWRIPMCRTSSWRVSSSKVLCTWERPRGDASVCVWSGGGDGAMTFESLDARSLGNDRYRLMGAGQKNRMTYGRVLWRYRSSHWSELT